jgi:RNA polymerase sigma factor (sigma-70 family)
MEKAQIALWVMEAQQGSKASLAALYQHFQPLLFSYAYKSCNNNSLADDAVHNAWLKVMQGLKKLQEPHAFRSWLYRAVRWQLLDQGRRVEHQVLDEQQMMAASEDSDMDLLRLVNQLPDDEREVIELFYLHELTVDEVSDILQLASGTIKSRLFRARKTLKQLYSGE